MLVDWLNIGHRIYRNKTDMFRHNSVLESGYSRIERHSQLLYGSVSNNNWSKRWYCPIVIVLLAYVLI